MFKILALVALVFTVANAHRYRRAEPNLRAQAQEVFQNAKANFPMDEFEDFWQKVQEQSGKSRSELKAKFDANKGNMDLTLEQVFENAQDKYPILSQQWNRIQATWEDKKDDMLELKSEKFSELYGKAKSYLEAKYGPIDFDDFKDNLSGYLAAVSMPSQRRFKRGAEPNLRAQAQEVYQNAKTNFPMEEFNAFWAKVSEKSGKTQDELKAKFDANKGNMDLTLEQAFDKAQDNYPILSQQWNRIKATWDDKKDDMLDMQDDKFSELYNKAKSYLESKYGPIDIEQFKQNLSGYLASVGMGQKRRFKRGAEPNLRAQASEVYENAKENFPMEEFNAFWAKVAEKSGKTQEELKAKFEANKGNMDLTLEQAFDKAQDNYPILSQQWNRIQATWADKKDDIVGVKSESLADLYAKAYAFLNQKFGPINFEKFKRNISQYLASIGMNVPARRRFRRDANLRDAYSQVKSRFQENFPKAEFDAFLSKLGEKAQMTKGEIQQKLDENKGNMDLTLEELSSKVQGDYPALQQQWSRVKSQWDQTRDEMDSTSLKDLFAKAKAGLESKFGPIDFDKFYSNIKNYLADTYAGLQSRRYKREIPAAVRPHVEGVQSHFKENFPKAEWDNFWPKFEAFMESMGKDAKTELNKHNGNMDLTLEEVKDKALDKYPDMEQKWNRVKAQMDECIGRMDETSIKDMFKLVKTHSEKILGQPIDEMSLKNYVGNLQAYFTTFYNRLQTTMVYY